MGRLERGGVWGSLWGCLSGMVDEENEDSFVSNNTMIKWRNLIKVPAVFRLLRQFCLLVRLPLILANMKLINMIVCYK